MYFLSLSVTLLVIIASVHLLAKVRNENLGILSKLLAYFVLLTAVLILACQLFRGVDKMERGGKKCKKECSSEMMMGGDAPPSDWTATSRPRLRRSSAAEVVVMGRDGGRGEWPARGESLLCALGFIFLRRPWPMLTARRRQMTARRAWLVAVCAVCR